MRIIRVTFAILLLALIAGAVYAQSVPAMGTTTNPPAAGPSPADIGMLLSMLVVFITKLQGGDKLGALIVFVNILANLFKMPWFQAVYKKLLMQKREWRLSKRGKIILVLVLGVVSVYALAPSAVWYRTLVKGVVVAFAAMGFHQSWRVLVRPKPGSEENA